MPIEKQLIGFSSSSFWRLTAVCKLKDWLDAGVQCTYIARVMCDPSLPSSLEACESSFNQWFSFPSLHCSHGRIRGHQYSWCRWDFPAQSVCSPVVHLHPYYNTKILHPFMVLQWKVGYDNSIQACKNQKGASSKIHLFGYKITKILCKGWWCMMLRHRNPEVESSGNIRIIPAWS